MEVGSQLRSVMFITVMKQSRENSAGKALVPIGPIAKLTSCLVACIKLRVLVLSTFDVYTQ